MSINFRFVVVLSILLTTDSLASGPEEPYSANLPDFAIARIGSTNYWHGCPFNLVTLSADGNVMATSGASKQYLGRGELSEEALKIRVWQARTGKLIHDFQLADVSRLLSLSLDGSKMASVDGKVLRLWNLKSGRQTHRLMDTKFGELKHVQFGPDGARVVAFSGSEITHWDCATGKPLRKVKIAKEPLEVDAVSSDATLLATGVGQEVIRLFGTESGKKVQTIATGAKLYDIAFSPTGTLLAASTGNLIKVFDTDSGTLVEQIALKQDRAVTVFFASNGKLGWLDSRGCLNLLDRMTQDRVLVAERVGREELALSQDGELIAVAGGPWARVWDLRTRNYLLEDAGVVTNHVELGLLPDGKVLLSRDGKSIKWHDPLTGRVFREVPAEGYGIRFSADSRLFCGFAEPWSADLVGIWETKSGRQVREFKIRPTNRSSFSFGRDGTELICIDRTGEVARWNITDGTRLKSWQIPREWHDVVLSPDGRTLISPPARKTPTRPFDNEWSISLLDIESGKKLWSLSVRDPFERAMHFSQDGTLVFSTRGELSIMGARTGRLEKSATLSHTLTGVQVSPKLDAFVGITDGIIRLWSVESGKELVSFGSPDDKAVRVQFAPDGEVLYSTSTNGTVLIWDLRRARLAGKPINRNRFVAQFDSDTLPLHRAAQLGLVNEVKALLDANADPNLQHSVTGAAPLHFAAAAGRTAVVKVLLATGANYDAATKGGSMPLHLACDAGTADVVQLLLQRGADPSAPVGRNRITPLHFACISNAANVVSLLIEAGADINAQISNGMTPLIVAARGGNLDAVKRLVEGGAKINLSPTTSTNALSGAAHFGHGDVVLYLLRNGAKVPGDLRHSTLEDKTIENLEAVRDRLIRQSRHEK